jgi:hypothetical protein
MVQNLYGQNLYSLGQPTLIVFNVRQYCMADASGSELKPLAVPCNFSSCFATLSGLLLKSKDQVKPNAGGFYSKNENISWVYIWVLLVLKTSKSLKIFTF